MQIHTLSAARRSLAPLAVTAGITVAASAWAEEPASSEPVAEPAPEPESTSATAPPTTPAPVEEELEAPVFRDIPPRFSWDVALSVSYGMMPQFDTRGWAGFGVRGQWGKNFGPHHRFGPTLGVFFEGAIAVQWTNNFEPGLHWEFVHEKKLWLGATLAVDLALHADRAGTLNTKLAFEAAPVAAFRIGFSQPFSIVRRRFFVGLEPKIRVMGGQPQFVGAIVIGSGAGY